MLAEEPDNQNLMDLRDQLTNAINQLQGTKNMVQRAQSSRQPGMLPHGMPGMGPDMARNKQAHSSRKNKPQRCSICGGIGHKSRTCTMAMQSQAAQQTNPQHVQWASNPSQCMSSACDGTQMYVPVPPHGGCGGYMIAPGQQTMQMGAGGQVVGPGGAVMQMPMGCCNGQQMMMMQDGSQQMMMVQGGGPVDHSGQKRGASVQVGTVGGEVADDGAAEEDAEGGGEGAEGDVDDAASEPQGEAQDEGGADQEGEDESQDEAESGADAS